MSIIKQNFKDARKYDSFFLKNEDGKVKELGGCLADIHTLLHMPTELFRHAGNNNGKADTNTEQLLKQDVDFAEAYTHWSFK